MSSLAEAWSIPSFTDSKPQTYSAQPPRELDVLAINDLLGYRCMAHDLACLIALVPSDETRLRDKALIPMFEHHRDSIATLKNALEGRGVPVPRFPDVGANWKSETEIDNETLHAALLPHMDQSAREYVESASAAYSAGTYHWSSLAAFISVSTDSYLQAMRAAQKSREVSTKGVGYSDRLLDDPAYATYAQGLMDEEFAQYVRVLTAEILRIRATPNETGWREEEAKKLVVGHMAMLAQYFGSN